MPDAASFWHEMLLPMYEDWRASPEKDHRAKALAQFANNMAERMAYRCGFKPYEYRLQLRQACPEFGLIWDLADSAKHVELGRPNAKMSHIDQAAMSKLIDDWGLIDEIKGWDEHQVLVITDDDGGRHKFADLIAVVMAKFRELLAKEGLKV